MRLSAEQCLTAISQETDRLLHALEGAPEGARVPTCPDWDADDLLWHLGEVQWFWARIVEGRPAGPDEVPERVARPADRAGLLAHLRASSADLRRLLGEADASEAAWSWSGDQSVGFTLRRQAHEALIHRLDAKLVAGLPHAPIDPALAADGVAEALDVMYGGEPPAGVAFDALPGHVEVRLTDVDRTLRVAVGTLAGRTLQGRDVSGPHLVLIEDADDAGPAEPAAVLEGTAADVDRWLWKRTGDDAVAWSGDVTTREAFLAAVRPSID